MAFFGAREELIFDVSGMTCQNCTNHVREALQTVPGVARATVDLDSHTARVTVKAGTNTTEMLKMAVKKAGYEIAPAAAPTSPGQ